MLACVYVLLLEGLLLENTGLMEEGPVWVMLVCGYERPSGGLLFENSGLMDEGPACVTLACEYELSLDRLLFESPGLMSRFILMSSFLADKMGCRRFDRTTGSLYTLCNLPASVRDRVRQRKHRDQRKPR